MALNNYANLKQAVERFSHRTDISDVIDDFIDLCEARINARLKLRTNEQRATATMPTADRFLALPDSFLEMRRLTISGASPKEIRFKAPESMTVESTAGVPEYFTITSQIEFNRVPDSGYTVEMSYYVSLTALSDSNTTNDVLTKYPDLYLYGTLSELHRWARDEEAAMYYDSTFEKKLLDAQKQERRGRFGPAPAMYSEGSTP
jgi:hypothetical protein